MRIDANNQVSKAISIAQLTKHHAHKLMPAGKVFNTFISFKTVYASIKDASRQKSSNLGKNILAFIHEFADFQQNRKTANSNRHRYKIR